MTNETILVIDDEPDIRDQLREILSDQGYHVLQAGDAAEARTMARQHLLDLVLLDIWMPGEDGMSLLKSWRRAGEEFQILMISGHGNIETAVEATKLGAWDFLEKPFSIDKILLSVERALDYHRVLQHSVSLSRSHAASEQLIGSSTRMQQLSEQARRLGNSNEPVLLWGETGCEFQAVAQQIHLHSSRKHRQMVDGSGSDMEARLLHDDTEHQRSLFLEARDSTLFLDPLTQLDQNTQKRLMSIFINGHMLRDDDTVIPVTARLIAATREHPDTAQKQGLMEPKVSGWLATKSVSIPPLRERLQDLPELITHYVDYYCSRESLPRRKFPDATLGLMRQHHWPRNVQQLRELIYQLLSGSDGADVSEDEVTTALQASTSGVDCSPKRVLSIIELPYDKARREFEQIYYQYHLHNGGGRVATLTQSTGMERTYLYRKLRNLGLATKHPAD